MPPDQQRFYTLISGLVFGVHHNPTADQTVTLPPSGVFNFTTVNIPGGITITFSHNAANTPVTILATGNVVINGTIQIGGKQATSRFTGGVGGPGGFNGGHGAFGFNNVTQGANGEGPGSGGGGKFIDGSCQGPRHRGLFC